MSNNNNPTNPLLAMNSRIAGEFLPSNENGRAISSLWKEAAKCFFRGDRKEVRQTLLEAKRLMEKEGIPPTVEDMMLGVIEALG